MSQQQINDHDMDGSAPPNSVPEPLAAMAQDVDASISEDSRLPADGSIFSLANMGTKNQNTQRQPNIKSAQTLQDLYNEYKQYKLLKKKDDMSSNNDVGSPAFLVSHKWLEKYHKFILYDQFEQNMSEDQLDFNKQTHFTQLHPGMMLNSDELCEQDQNRQNLYGTGKIKGMESQFIDQYLESNKNNQYDFHIYNEEMWNFLFERYGGQTIQRYYIRKSNQHYTVVEARLKQITLKLLNCQNLLGGPFNKNMMKQWWTQISQNSTLKELKERIVDHLNCAGQNITINDIRLWMYIESEVVEDQSLEARCQAVQRGGAAPNEDDPKMEDAGDNIQIELNSGVEFPGQSLEPLINSALRLQHVNFNKKQLIVAEFRDSQNDKFAFKFKIGEKLVIGVCEWCNSRNILRTICKCKNVKYCNDECMEKDKRFHIDKCSAQADGELQQELDGDWSEDSKKGLVGLTNLGNTCYMNSSIQCLSNTYELTKFFLERKYKSLIEKEIKNPLGTEGRLVQAWAKLITEMWKNSNQVVRPDLFKRILGQYNVTFEGYGQHDSQECINTILDFMTEDLYKKDKKPYVEQTDADGKSDAEASQEAWNKHIYRNESVICDLFHGQFKSTLICSLCNRVSITFDPFLMATVPIPSTKWVTKSGYFIQYHLNPNGTGQYCNQKLEVKVKENDKVHHLRMKIQEKYGIPRSQYLITWVCDMKLVQIFNDQMQISELEHRAGVMLFFEIPKELKPQLPPIEQINKFDSNNGIDQDWVKVAIHIFKEGESLLNLPRFIWVRKSWTLVELHHHFFDYIKDLFTRWFAEIKETGKSNKCRQMPNYKHPDTGELLNADSLAQLFTKEPLEKQFKAFFPILFTDDARQALSAKNFELNLMPYQLKVENNSGYMQECHFCSSSSCRQHCMLPYDPNQTVLDMLHKIGVEDNVSFYGEKRGKNDFILNLIWQRNFEVHFQRHLSSVQGEAPLVDTYDQNKEDQKKDVSIDDCFDEFKKPEILDQDNQWYCNKCKTHVQATKKIEIYKAPPIFIVSLKRFKQEKSSHKFYGMYGGGGHGQKIDDQVDFPLEGLDMSKYIIGNETKEESMIYDCYAVSNHYGNMGFGHYTAYGQNPLDNNWYEFDDSSVRMVNKSNLQQTIVTNAAYNLFYRRRDWHKKNMENGIDYDALAIKPDLAQIEKTTSK